MSDSKRQPKRYAIGNWKMNGDRASLSEVAMTTLIYGPPCGGKTDLVSELSERLTHVEQVVVGGCPFLPHLLPLLV